ncbi:hypothetical protein FFLO_04685 [Filobasidium floriforme]|uniref:Protein CPL1-like domain-containing protein n=1 Tax=Filobasidium floriforme TaxID=5210 RepID=A0A8K0JIA0_9TREE|nr:hypothetical protein FFLO_04685 [Filobasidium floriforme]
MRFSLAIFALPLALAIPSPVTNSSGLVSRAENILYARTNLGSKAPGKKNNVVCGTIKVNKYKYICACYDLGEDTCYRADSDNEDNIVEDDGLISTVIRELEGESKLCYLPEHAKPDFKKGCCIYKCKKNFKDCGNKCVKKNKDCPTAGAGGDGGHSGHGGGYGGGYGYNHYDRRNLQCAAGLSACPVVNGNGFECLDVNKDVESCGGCLRSIGAGIQNVGEDCTSIPNAADVSCVAGQCQVQTCLPGFKLNSVGDCVFSEEAYFLQQKYRL